MKDKSRTAKRTEQTEPQPSRSNAAANHGLERFRDGNNSSESLPELRHSATTTSIQYQMTDDTEPGPLGLNVVYTPPNGHKADIVFVHGLGGNSRWTWSKYKNPELFWPLTFLPLEPDVCLARILTFGYNANFRKGGNAGTSVLDFAKDLLFDLKYARDERMDDLEMGNVSLIR